MPTANYLQARLLRLAAVRREHDAWWPNQYGSLANPAAHRYGTGAEICAEVPEAHAIFVATSTGGTAAGIAQAVRDRKSATRVIPVDVPGSHALVAGCGQRLLPGVGSPNESKFVEAAERERTMIVADAYGIAASRELAEQTGLSVGGSGGLAFVAALRWLAKQPPSVVVVVCADAKSSYDFSDVALAQRNIILPPLTQLVDDFFLGGRNCQPRGSSRASAELD
jgi:cysteine synthase